MNTNTVNKNNKKVNDKNKVYNKPFSKTKKINIKTELETLIKEDVINMSFGG